MSTYVSTVDVFCRLAGSDLPNIADLIHAKSQRQLKPGEALFHVGDSVPFAFVVNIGVIKLVYETPAGDSWIKGFVEAGTCFASLMALKEEGVTNFSAYAATESTIDIVEYRKLEQLADRHIEWQRALGNAFKYYGQRKEKRELELLTQSPEERYLGFLSEYSELSTCIRQHDIASYIRVTPVALSRIRARLKVRGILA